MCYTGECKYERFNPATGTCLCKRGSNPCPEDMYDTFLEQMEDVLLIQAAESGLDKELDYNEEQYFADEYEKWKLNQL